MKKFGANKNNAKEFKIIKAEKKWSFEEFSQISGIDVKILIGIETEEDFEIEFLFILCRVYGIKLHEFFFNNKLLALIF